MIKLLHNFCISAKVNCLFIYFHLTLTLTSYLTIIFKMNGKIHLFQMVIERIKHIKCRFKHLEDIIGALKIRNVWNFKIINLVIRIHQIHLFNVPIHKLSMGKISSKMVMALCCCSENISA